ncbi:D-lactate dehydrogenase, partial [Coniochaeta hoffmannii]
MADTEPQAWYLNSKFPVFWPQCEALTLPEDDFEAYLQRIQERGLENNLNKTDVEGTHGPGDADDDTFTLVSEQPSTTADVRLVLGSMDMCEATENEESAQDGPSSSQDAFMAGLVSHGEPREVDMSHFTMDGKMLTENADFAYRSTNSALVDLFFELEDVVSGPRLLELLNAAWTEDPLATLKLIFNARSIHIGKSSRHTFYRCAGWLATYHPLTLVANLQWLSRPVIEKKVSTKDDKEDSDTEVIEDESDPARFDVRHGVAHGYWKDLLNILALSANGHLTVLSTPRDILNIENQTAGPVRSKEDTREEQTRRHDDAVQAFTSNPTHHALHLKTARLFASQLKTDLALLDNPSDAPKTATISLCAKWAPSPQRFHDKHTTIATSIAEILFPPASFPPFLIPTRETYLRHARESYRRLLTRLRARLDIVERPLTKRAYGDIQYPSVPSLAMRAYAPLFAERDGDRFGEYLAAVKAGTKQISGAVLMPSVLVRDALAAGKRSAGVRSHKKARAFDHGRRVRRGGRRGVGLGRNNNTVLETKARELRDRTLDAQWDTLVRRVKDSGTLESCIAICDVSGSMTYPTFADGTAPIHTAIGLSLLMAEVVAPPFGGAFVTFSARPTVEKVDLTGTLGEKVAAMERSEWGMNTDLVAVFEKLILPMAVENKLTQEQMVKRLFVFSDMQFDAAERGDRWATSFERIEKEYMAAG